MIKQVFYNHKTIEVLNENYEVTLKMNHQFEDLGGFDDDFFVVINQNMIELRNETGDLIISMEKGNRKLNCVYDGYIYLLHGEELEKYNRNLTLMKK
jgi:hypothetical protein